MHACQKVAPFVCKGLAVLLEVPTIKGRSCNCINTCKPSTWLALPYFALLSIVWEPPTTFNELESWQGLWIYKGAVIWKAEQQFIFSDSCILKRTWSALWPCFLMYKSRTARNPVQSQQPCISWVIGWWPSACLNTMVCTHSDTPMQHAVSMLEIEKQCACCEDHDFD